MAKVALNKNTQFEGKNGRIITVLNDVVELPGKKVKVSIEKDGKTVNKVFPDLDTFGEYLDIVEASIIEESTEDTTSSILDDGFGDINFDREVNAKENGDMEIKVEAEVLAIKPDDLLFKSFPLKEELREDDITELFVFGVDMEAKKIVVSPSKYDSDTRRIEPDLFFNAIEIDALREIASINKKFELSRKEILDLLCCEDD